MFSGVLNPGVMMGSDIRWDDLPATVRAAIEEHTGRVAGTSPGGDGVSTDFRLILDTASGSVFIKGTGPDSHWAERERLTLGAALAAHVTPLSPPLLWQAHADGWDITGWPALEGHPADLTPGADLDRILPILRTLSAIPAPDVPGLQSTGEFWGIPGDMLTHTDPQPANFIIGPEKARMIDWGWAMRGPSWLTAARLIPHLLIAGWSPADAEQALSSIPAWTDAPSDAITAYAQSHADSWDDIYRKRPASHQRRWRDATRAWADYRREGNPSRT